MVTSFAKIAVLALAAASLTLLVTHAHAFAHNDTWLALLLARWWLGWALTALWAGLLLWRRRLAPESTALLLERFWGAALLLVLIAASAPFMNAYFTAVSHPALALALAWTCWPGLERLGARLRGGALSGALSPWLAAGIAALVIFVQSYRRHYWFGSAGKDLGLFHQSIWLLSRGESPNNTIMGMNAFADHMELIDLLAVPTQWLWPHASSLLLFQALIVASGIVPLFWLARARTGSAAAGWAFAAAYLFNIELQNAVMFDWNPTTCGVGFLPWVVWFFHRGRAAAFAVALGLAMLAKENLALYAGGLCLALALGSSEARARRMALAGAALAAALFVIEMKLLFPIFREAGFRHMRYEAMGSGAGDIVLSALESPYRAWSLLFTPGKKIDGLLAAAASTAFVALLSPRYLLALAPALLERFWSTHSNRWWGYHYGAGAAVLAVLAATEALPRLRAWGEGLRWRSLVGVTISTVALAALLVGTLGRFGPGPLAVWWHGYYTPRAERQESAAALESIPPDASVAAQNHLIPHLSARREIYEIGRPIRAEYVALHLGQSAWPFGDEYPRELARQLLGGAYGVAECRGKAVVLKRGAESKGCAALEPARAP